MFDDIAVVIPVRLGSSRIHEKALLPFADSNLLDWKINQLLKITNPSNIYVSTESEKLKQIAVRNKVKIHHRDFYLSDGHKASFSEVITGIVKDIPFKHIAWVTAVVPLMGPSDYKKGFNLYQQKVVETQMNDSLFSANLLKEYLWNSKKPVNYNANKNHTISQDLPDTYRVTNGLYMSSKKNILKNNYLLGINPYKFVVPKIAGIDIDDIDDYNIATALLDTYMDSHANTN